MSATIVSLADARRRRQPGPLAQLEAYWSALPRAPGVPVPSRTALDPRGLDGTLGRLVLAGRLAPGIMAIRVAGREIDALFDLPTAGLPLSVLFEPRSRPELASCLESMLTAPARLRLGLSAQRGFARPAFEAEFLALPLADRQGRITRCVAVLGWSGPAAKAPCRFRIASASLVPLVARPRPPDARRSGPRPHAAT